MFAAHGDIGRAQHVDAKLEDLVEDGFEEFGRDFGDFDETFLDFFVVGVVDDALLSVGEDERETVAEIHYYACFFFVVF